MRSWMKDSELCPEAASMTSDERRIVRVAVFPTRPGWVGQPGRPELSRLALASAGARVKIGGGNEPVPGREAAGLIQEMADGDSGGGL